MPESRKRRRWPENENALQFRAMPTDYRLLIGGERVEASGGAYEVVNPATEQELWKALDEGRDPTDPERDVRGADPAP